eukprot:5232797-Pleurochrysis_carterae.AAC.1
MLHLEKLVVREKLVGVLDAEERARQHGRSLAQPTRNERHELASRIQRLPRRGNRRRATVQRRALVLCCRKWLPALRYEPRPKN